MKTNNEIDDMIKSYICESPDNGDTVYYREMGSSDKELISDDIMISSNPSDYYIDTQDDTIDLSGILTHHGIGANVGTIYNNSNSITTDAFEDFNDISLDVNGKTRKISELFTSVDAIEKRLGILRPDPKLLDKYELLQSLYEQYKAAEAMLYEGNNEEEEFSF